MKPDCTDTTELYEKESITAAMERNDCVVRAVASCFDVPYDRSHAYIKTVFERRDKKGTTGTALRLAGLKEAFGKKIEIEGEIIPELDPNTKLLRRRYRKRG